MAFYLATEYRPIYGNHVAIERYVGGVAISVGDPLIMQTDGYVDPCASGTLDTSTDGSGLVGVALNSVVTVETDPVDVALFESLYLILPAKTTAPTLAILGVTQTTLYAGDFTSDVLSILLGTTSNGVLRMVNFHWPESRPLVSTNKGLALTVPTGDTDARVLCRVPLDLCFTHGDAESS